MAHRKVTLTVAQVINARTTIFHLLQTPLPYHIAYTIVKNSLVLEEEGQMIEVGRVELLKEYCEPGKDKIEETDPGYDTWLARWKEFIATETTLDLELIDENLIPESFTISPSVLSGLWPLLIHSVPATLPE